MVCACVCVCTCARVHACVHVCVHTCACFSGPQSPCLSDGRLSVSDALALASQVTSALQPLRPAVHHLQSARGDTSLTVSQLLLGLPRLVPVARVSEMLDEVVKRVYEVIDIQAQGAASPPSSPRWWGRGSGGGGGALQDEQGRGEV